MSDPKAEVARHLRPLEQQCLAWMRALPIFGEQYIAAMELRQALIKAEERMTGEARPIQGHSSSDALGEQELADETQKARQV